MKLQVKFLLTIVLCSASCASLLAQETSCSEVDSIGRIARARSSAGLVAEKQRAGKSYRVQVIFAARQFELDQRNENAAALLLGLIPQNDAQQLVWMTLGESLCDAEPVQDIMLLGRLRDRLAHDLASAVILVPKKMQAYVSYAAEAVQDPHNDYAIQMQRVCRSHHVAFASAVKQLGDGSPEVGTFATASSDWFRTHILDPKSCRAVALPEAD
jgi:hypothetical protein